MINPVFTVIGLWIAMMLITFLVTCIVAIAMNDKTDDFTADSTDVFIIALALVVVILELLLCSAYVKFKNNPENYGYTKIEQEATEVSE